MLSHQSNHGYRGICVRRREIAGLIISERRYAADLAIPPHSHEHPFLCAILEGGSSEQCGGKTWDCTPDTVFVRPSGLTHANRVLSRLRFLGIELVSNWSARWDKPLLLPKDPVKVHGTCPALTRRLYREFCSVDAASALVVEGLVLEMLGESCRVGHSSETGLPQWLRRAQALLHARYRQRTSLAELAGQVGVHPLHLARVFRRTYGCAVGSTCVGYELMMPVVL